MAAAVRVFVNRNMCALSVAFVGSGKVKYTVVVVDKTC